MRPSRDSAEVQDASPSFCVSSTSNAPGRRADRAGVADLAALLGVEVRAVEQQADLVVLSPARPVADDGVVLDPAEHRGRRGQAVVLGRIVGRAAIRPERR